MKFENYMTLEFPSRSSNEAFARSAVACFAAQLDPTLEELGDNGKLLQSLGVRLVLGEDYLQDLNEEIIFRTPGMKYHLPQLEAARKMTRETGRKYMVYYSERLHVESAVYAGQLIEEGAIGTPIHVDGFGPHRVGDPKSRPDWFFEKEKYGGILCDIGSHQIEQFLYYCHVKDANVQYSEVGNYGHPDYPELEDFGDAMLV